MRLDAARDTNCSKPPQDLAEAVAAIEAGPAREHRRLPIGEHGPLLECGVIHEWLAGGDEHTRNQSKSKNLWLPPLGLLIDLARRALELSPAKRIVWIGRRCHPYPHALVRRDGAGGADFRLLERSVFVDPTGRGERAWSIDLALRCPGVAAVVADGQGLTMAESRRLQLAADAGGAIGLLARPAGERGEISAARTRWLVTPAPTAAHEQAWTLDLLRCKGMQPRARRWSVRRDHATGVIREWAPGDVGLAPDVLDRPAETARASLA